MKLENGTIIKQYKIISAIGKGGMGEVFLAQDTKLERRVAVKFLNDEFGRDTDKVRRFIREAKAASALNHPNILTVYEIGAEGSTNYIAAEFIDGKALTDHIAEDKISLESVLDVSIQIVSALQTAHSAGIVHRDIKPDNVMIRRDGIVKVLDFGLAKLTEKPIAEDLNLEAATIAKLDTVPGVVMGTPNYMSPEQARGKDIDRQTDIFSFGVVLYEMLTRKLPFAGETVSDIIASILTRQPRPIEEFNESVPADLRAIVNKTLEKDKSKRYPNAEELLEDLKSLKKRIESGEELERTILPQTDNQETQILKAAITGDDAQTTSKNSRVSVSLEKSSLNKILIAVAGVLLIAAIGLGYWFYSKNNVKQIESVAVMPFVNESGNADNDYLSDGMTETLIGSLSQLPNLNVKARSSVFRYKGKETNAQTIGKELNVQTILNGRVVQRGEQLTLSLELIDVQTENVLWSESYNRRQGDLVTLQSEIARDVSGKLKAKLSGADATKVEKTYTTNAEAYQFYLKGRYFGRQFTLDGFNKAVESYNKALALDPNYALAYAGLSDAYYYASTIHLPPLEALPKAEEYARKALGLDDSLAAAHHSIANVKSNFDHDFAGAEREYERAIELDPNDASIYLDYAWHSTDLGEFDKGISLAERAHQIDPFAGEISAYLGGAYSMAGQNDKAIEHLQATLKIDDRNWWAYYWLGVAYNQKGMFDRSIEAFQTAAKLDNSPLIRGALAHALARSGNKAEAQRVIDKLLEESKTRFVSQSSLVIAYAGLGDKEKAFEWLEKSYEAHDEGILFLKSHPMLAPLRDDPRFKAMLKRMNLPE